eukprot:1305224-Rhodomonas_salina.2
MPGLIALYQQLQRREPPGASCCVWSFNSTRNAAHAVPETETANGATRGKARRNDEEPRNQRPIPVSSFVCICALHVVSGADPARSTPNAATPTGKRSISAVGPPHVQNPSQDGGSGAREDDKDKERERERERELGEMRSKMITLMAGGFPAKRPTVRNQVQETAISVHCVPRIRFLVFDFGVYPVPGTEIRS